LRKAVLGSRLTRRKDGDCRGKKKAAVKGKKKIQEKVWAGPGFNCVMRKMSGLLGGGRFEG